MFHKIVNNKIEIPHENILIKSQFKTRSTHNQTFRQIQCNKELQIFLFLQNNKPENITTDAFKEGLSHKVLLKTFPYLQ